MTNLKERVRMALAEAGYPAAGISGSGDNPSVAILPTPGGVPDRVCWKAFRVATINPLPCFVCYDEGFGDECYDGDCHAWRFTNVE